MPDDLSDAKALYEKTTGKKYEKGAYQAWASSPAGKAAWKNRKKPEAAEKPKASGSKTYRKPDGSTYKQYGGPRSAQDVEVEGPAKKPAPKPGPTPKPTPKPPPSAADKTASDAAEALRHKSTATGVTTSGDRTGQDTASRRARAAADKAAADALLRDKVQGTAAEDIIEEGEGLGGASEANKKKKGNP